MYRADGPVEMRPVGEVEFVVHPHLLSLGAGLHGDRGVPNPAGPRNEMKFSYLRCRDSADSPRGRLSHA
jgi:hypothetical protein